MATAKEKRLAREEALRAEGAASALAKINLQAGTNPGGVPDTHGPILAPQRSGATVVVACKMGVSHVDIQHCKIVTKFEQNMQGGRNKDEAERVGAVVRLRGTAYPRGTPPKGFPPPPEIVAGAALTRGVDKEWFDEWLRQNHLNPLVVNRMIFAHETEDGVRGQARELAEFLSGLDPINPEGDSRIPRSTREEVSNIETEETRKAKMRGAIARA